MSTEIILRLEGELLREIDSAVKNLGLSSRKEAVESILQRWYAALMKHKVDRETEVYYESLTPEEIEEDRTWVEFTSKQAFQKWDD